MANGFPANGAKDSGLIGPGGDGTASRSATSRSKVKQG
jgi:hypothetical protein